VSIRTKLRVVWYTNQADTNRKRKRAPASLENQSIHTTLPPERHRVDKSSLIIKDKLSKFKSSTDFASILEMEGRAYFDRTRYISVLNAYEEEPILFLRPRRFGKSLTVDMLEHFHGLQYRDEHKSLYKVSNHALISLICYAGLTCFDYHHYRVSMYKTILQMEEWRLDNSSSWNLIFLLSIAVRMSTRQTSSSKTI